MKVLLLATAVAASLLPGAEGLQPFTVVDREGQQAVLDWGQADQTTVVVFLSTRCSVSSNYSARIRDLARKFAGPKFRWAAVFPGRQEELPEILFWTESQGLEFPVYRDPGGRIAQPLGVKVTPEIAVIGKNGELLYRGRVDDHHNPARVKDQSLLKALRALVAGRAPEPSATTAFGCALAY